MDRCLGAWRGDNGKIGQISVLRWIKSSSIEILCLSRYFVVVPEREWDRALIVVVVALLAHLPRFALPLFHFFAFVIALLVLLLEKKRISRNNGSTGDGEWRMRMEMTDCEEVDAPKSMRIFALFGIRPTDFNCTL